VTKVVGLFRNADEVKHTPAGTVIFSEGDAGTEMFGVISGAVELRSGDTMLAKLGPDDVFGEMALVDSSPRMATATALEDSELAVITRRHFLFLVHETPTFALQVMAALADRLRRLT
jgi:CRP-like cAMP-binding protein